VYALAILTAILLAIFRGLTDRLIPLYAVGAFMAFTLSQAGMVMHWNRVGGPGARKSMFLNGLGAIATAITVAVVLVAKFTEGAWITPVLIPAMILMMRGIKRHYGRVEKETQTDVPVNTQDLCAQLCCFRLIAGASFRKKLSDSPGGYRSKSGFFMWSAEKRPRACAEIGTG
jgi:hypothetical protein